MDHDDKEANMVIPALDTILKGTKYEDVLSNYEKFFQQAKIVTIRDLENCPRYAGSNLCGHSTHEFIAFVRECTLNPPDPEPEPPPKKAAPKRKRATAKKKKAEPEPELITADPEPEKAEVVSDVDEEDVQSSSKE